MIILKGREIRQNEILDAARDLFLRDGYTGTSITAILEKSLISRGTLYYYFKSKEELLDKLVERYGEGLVTSWKTVIYDTAASPLERLNRLLEMAWPVFPGTGGTGGQSPGLHTGGQSPGLNTGGQSPGLHTGGQSPGLDTGGQSPGLNTRGQSPGLHTGGQSPELNTGGQSPGLNTGGQSPGLRMFYDDRNLLFRARMERTVRSLAEELWVEAFIQGKREGLFSRDDPGAVTYTLLSLHSMVEEAATAIVTKGEGDKAEEICGLFRSSLETFLGLPAGSILFPGADFIADLSG